MANIAEMEILRRVWVDGHCIEVGDFEAPEYLELRTTGKNSEYFGALNISLHHETALLLGEALIACAKEKQDQIKNKGAA